MQAKESIITAAIKSSCRLPSSAFAHLGKEPALLVRLLPVLLPSNEYEHTIDLLKSSDPGLGWAEHVIGATSHND